LTRTPWSDVSWLADRLAVLTDHAKRRGLSGHALARLSNLDRPERNDQKAVDTEPDSSIRGLGLRRNQYCLDEGYSPFLTFLLVGQSVS
jgi:hypothetical protein